MSLLFLFLLFTSFTLFFEKDIVVFQRGESGYFCVRIPALLTTAKGTLIAFGEARKHSCADNTQIDIAYKRSLDNGKTWSELKILYSVNGTNDYVGNFAPVQLKYNQRILVPFCRSNRMLMQTYSDDDGLTFAQPQVIYNITKPDWEWVALGPPGGILLQSNRIVIPGDFSTSEGHFSQSFVMLNDFNGEVDKWYMGGVIALEDYHPNECQAVELLPNNNTIFVNSRSDSTVRIGSYSNDGGLTFTKIQVLNNLVQPLHGCEGSTMYHEKSHQLFYTGLAEISTMRTNLSLHISEDYGESWRYIKTIWPGPSSYSALTTLNDQSVGVLYEAGTSSPVDFIMFTILFNQTEKRFV